MGSKRRAVASLAARTRLKAARSLLSHAYPDGAAWPNGWEKFRAAHAMGRRPYRMIRNHVAGRIGRLAVVRVERVHHELYEKRKARTLRAFNAAD